MDEAERGGERELGQVLVLSSHGTTPFFEQQRVELAPYWRLGMGRNRHHGYLGRRYSK